MMSSTNPDRSESSGPFHCVLRRKVVSETDVHEQDALLWKSVEGRGNASEPARSRGSSHHFCDGPEVAAAMKRVWIAINVQLVYNGVKSSWNIHAWQR